jgi:hypothetical protein
LGGLGVPDNDGVNRGFPPSKARVSEQPGFGKRSTTTMLDSMKRSFWLWKEITVYEYERGLLYREGRLKRFLEPGRYRFGVIQAVDVVKVSLREMTVSPDC